MRRAFREHELLLVTLIALLCVVIGLRNPSFFSLGNVFDLLKSSVTPGILALGVLIVLISGNIDISFPAIAAFSMYVTTLVVRQASFADHIVLVFAIAGGLGCLLGFGNAFLIHHFRLPALIVTLGTASVIRGALLAFVGTRIINNLPESMVSFSKARLFREELPSGETVGLAASVVLLAVLSLFVWILLRCTLLGRGIYALGGSPEAARRVGFKVGRIQFFIYGFVGCLSGFVGIIHASSMRNANPFDIVGVELTVIAAVVLGGASITGGRGTVPGAVLGVLLLVIINNSLILVGLPPEWHKVATGLVIVSSTAWTAWRVRAEGARAA